MNGYKNKNVVSMYWLAIFMMSGCGYHTPWEEIAEPSGIALLKKCLELEPDNDAVRKEYINQSLDWISFSQHEWPSEILSGMDGASYESCLWMKRELVFIRSLDKKSEHEEYLAEFEKKLDVYMKE